MKKIAGILFVIGMLMIFGEAGADDLMMEMHQEHTINMLKLVAGVLMMIPLPMVYKNGQ